ncbi:hypothetical protein ABGB16_21520 [Micromonospora sp. B11E3]|uniref:hypothetical protein n=1 Tax=Micromonospora sp. B11E3 TaxID=3153562 RepID=UPI00325ED698
MATLGSQSHGKPEQIAARWQTRQLHLPGIADSLVRYPETVALAALLTSTPSLLLTLRKAPDAPSPMQFLLAATRCLNHPAPTQVLRRGHPLFRWAGVPNAPRSWWLNTSEPDRTIYQMLSENQVRPEKAQNPWDNIDASTPT